MSMIFLNVANYVTVYIYIYSYRFMNINIKNKNKVAGGNGLFLKFILECYKNLKGYVLERPSVVERANKLF